MFAGQPRIISSNYLEDEKYNGEPGPARRLIDEGDLEGLKKWCASNRSNINQLGDWPSWSMSPPDADIPQDLLAYAAKYGDPEAVTPPPLRYNAFDAALPTDCFFHVLKFWRSDYGAASYLEPSPSRSDLLRAFYEDEHEEDSEEEDY